jgi:death-on-curing protein
MKYTTLQLAHILQLHVLAIGKFGGSDGLRDLGRLESAVATQTQEVFGEALYATVFEKSAALIRNIMGDHPFVDGNKRTAMLAGLTLIELNGYQFMAQLGEIEDFAVRVVVEHLDISTIADWLETHSRQV